MIPFIGYFKPSKRINILAQRRAMGRHVAWVRDGLWVNSFEERNPRSNKQLKLAIEECKKQKAVLLLCGRISEEQFGALSDIGIGYSYCAPWFYESADSRA